MLASPAIASLLSVLVVAPTPPRAEERRPLTDDEQAEVLAIYEDGKVLFNAGQYEAAIAAFEAALELSGDQTFLFNIALARDRMGDLEGALDALERYRDSVPTADRKPLDQRIQGLKIRIAARDAGAAAKAEPEPAPSAEPPAPSPPPPVVECPDPVLPPAPIQVDDTRIMTPSVITLLAATGVTLVVGGVLGGVSLAAQRNADGSCVGADDERRCSESAATDLRRARRTAVAADVMFAISGGLAIGTIAAVVTNVTKRRRRGEKRTALAGTIRF